jgi:hypothetical protein
VECRAVGGDGQHLRLKLRDADPNSRRSVTWPAIAFGLSASAADVREGRRLDVVYSLTADRGGALELRVKDIAPTEQKTKPDQKGGPT